MLIEGKEPPRIEEQGDAVKVTLLAGALSVSFRTFVAEESQRGVDLTVDHLLVLQYLLTHPEIDTTTVVRICQRRENDARDILSQMEVERDYLERGGSGRGTYWTLCPDLLKKISTSEKGGHNRRIDWEAAKTRVLSILKQQVERGETGLTNAEIRKVTRMDRNQVFRLMKELIEEDSRVSTSGKGRAARYVFKA